MTDYSQYGALTLAYIGDTVYELYNREKTVAALRALLEAEHPDLVVLGGDTAGPAALPEFPILLSPMWSILTTTFQT